MHLACSSARRPAMNAGSPGARLALEDEDLDGQGWWSLLPRRTAPPEPERGLSNPRSRPPRLPLAGTSPLGAMGSRALRVPALPLQRRPRRATPQSPEAARSSGGPVAGIRRRWELLKVAHPEHRRVRLGRDPQPRTAPACAACSGSRSASVATPRWRRPYTGRSRPGSTGRGSRPRWPGARARPGGAPLTSPWEPPRSSAPERHPPTPPPGGRRPPRRLWSPESPTASPTASPTGARTRGPRPPAGAPLSGKRPRLAGDISPPKNLSIAG